MKQANAVGDGIAGPQIGPLAKVPLRESRNELGPICKKFDLHTAGEVANRLSKAGQQTRVVACRALPTAA